jgi:hypothetical protein
MTGSRRDFIKTIGASAVVLEGTAGALAQSSCPTDAFLAQYEPAWRPLDRQLREVLRQIYGRLKDLTPPTKLSPAELRTINGQLSFYWGAGAPVLPHIEERTIDVPSGPSG